MEMEWQDPPIVKAGPKTKFQQVVDALQKNPGKWARVRKSMKTTSGTGLWKGYGCEAVARAVEGMEGRWDVYARWPLPENEEPLPAGTDVYELEAAPMKPAVPKPNTLTVIDRLATSPLEAALKARWPETTHLDPDDPNDQYLARQRAQLEADRKARQAKAERQRDGVRR